MMRVQSQGNTLIPVVSFLGYGFGNETVKAVNSYKRRAASTFYPEARTVLEESQVISEKLSKTSED
jgi:hypothetical protein